MMQHIETRSFWTVKFRSWQPWAFSSVLPVISNVDLLSKDEWKVFLPPLCRFFDKESDLQKHSTTVHGQVSQKVRCPNCDRAFLRKDHLKAHIESVHREGASKFICHPCQKSFSNSSNLIRHLASTSRSGVDKSPETKRQRPPASTYTSANVRWVFAG